MRALSSILLLQLVWLSTVYSDEKCDGFMYRPKRDNIAVYEEPDEKGDVLGYVSVGEHVCRIGEREGFAVIRWSGEVGYIRASLLWPPRNQAAEGENYLLRVKNFFRNLIW